MIIVQKISAARKYTTGLIYDEDKKKPVKKTPWQHEADRASDIVW